MAVKDVYAPKAEHITDVTDTKKSEGEIGEWQKKAREAKSRLEYVEAQTMIDKLTDREAPEPPFQVKGSINYGNIDMQEQQRQAREAAEIAQKEAGNKIDKAQENEKAVREELHNAQLLMVQQALNGKIDQLQKAVEAGMTQKNFGQQVAEIRELASELGYRKAEDAPSGGGGNIQLQIEMLRLQMNDKQQDRDFKWRMRQDDKSFQLEIQRMNDDRTAKAAELERQKNKDDMWANFPKHIGSAISKGLVDSPGVAAQPSKPKSYHVETGEGEGGEIECNDCHQPVAIGATARKAVCASCGASYSIKRVKAEPVEPVDEPVDTYEPEEA